MAIDLRISIRTGAARKTVFYSAEAIFPYDVLRGAE